MKIIELQALSNGAHRNQTSSEGMEILKGWAMIPENIEIPESFPFVDIESKIENGVNIVTKLLGKNVQLQKGQEKKIERIMELKQFLSDTDYAIIKIAEGVATKEEYSAIIAQRQQWRNEINELEKK